MADVHLTLICDFFRARPPVERTSETLRARVPMRFFDEEPPMPIQITDLFQPADEYAATLQEAMTVLVARYPEAVFSDIEWTEPTIWVWPSNAASQNADPAQAIAWLRETSPASALPPECGGV